MPLLTRLNLSTKLKASEILSQLSGTLLSSVSKSECLHERLPEILVVPREKTPTGAAARGNP